MSALLGKADGGFFMVTRRNFLIRASAALVCAPAVVLAASLMPIRSVILPTGRYYGFVERVFLSAVGPPATELINTGLSAEEAARELNRRRTVNMNDAPWEALQVLGVIRAWQDVKPRRPWGQAINMRSG
jgi:hypothetical protein